MMVWGHNVGEYQIRWKDQRRSCTDYSRWEKISFSKLSRMINRHLSNPEDRIQALIAIHEYYYFDLPLCELRRKPEN